MRNGLSYEGKQHAEVNTRVVSQRSHIQHRPQLKPGSSTKSQVYSQSQLKTHHREHKEDLKNAKPSHATGNQSLIAASEPSKLIEEKSTRQGRKRSIHTFDDEWEYEYVYEEIKEELPKVEKPKLQVQTLPIIQIIQELPLTQPYPLLNGLNNDKPPKETSIPSLPKVISPEVSVRKKGNRRILRKNPLLDDRVELPENLISCVPEVKVNHLQKRRFYEPLTEESFLSPTKKKVWGIEHYRNDQTEGNKLQGTNSIRFFIERPKHNFQFPLHNKKSFKPEVNEAKRVREEMVDAYLGYSKQENLNGVLEKSHFPQVPRHYAMAINLQRNTRSKSGSNSLALYLRKQREALERLQKLKQH